MRPHRARPALAAVGAVLAVLSLLPGAARPVAAQQSAAPTIYYLGQETDGQSALFAVSTGAPRQLSAPSERVLQYLPQPNGGVAYLVSVSMGVGLRIVTTTDTAGPGLDVDAATATLVRADATTLWLLTTDAATVPTLRGIDPATGQVVAERVFTRPNIDVLLHPSAPYGVAFQPSTGAINTFALPSLASLPLALEGLAAGSPVWAPHGGAPAFAMLTAPVANPAARQIALVRMSADGGTTTTIPLPDVAPAATVGLSWHPAGKFVAVTTNALDGGTARVMLVDVTAAQARSAEDVRAVVAWSPAAQASRALASRADGTLAVLDLSEGSLTALDTWLSGAAPLVAAWSPSDPDALAVMTLAASGFIEIIAVNVATGARTLLHTSDDPGLAQGVLLWTPDGSTLVFSSVSTDDVAALLGLGDVLFAVDTASQTVTRLSPDAISVLAGTIRVR